MDYKESWALKNWCFLTVVLEKTLKSPLDSKEIQPVHPKGNQSWIFIRRTYAETPILWLPDVKNWLIGKHWCWERLKVGGEGDNRGWDGCITNTMDMSLSRLWQLVISMEAWLAAVHGVAKSWAGLSDWIELNQGHMPFIVNQNLQLFRAPEICSFFLLSFLKDIVII